MSWPAEPPPFVEPLVEPFDPDPPITFAATAARVVARAGAAVTIAARSCNCFCVLSVSPEIGFRLARVGERAFGRVRLALHARERRLGVRDLLRECGLAIVQLSRDGVELRDQHFSRCVDVVEHRGAPGRVEDVGSVTEQVTHDKCPPLIGDQRALTAERGQMLLLGREGNDRPLRCRLLILQLVVPRGGGVVTAVAWLSARSAAVTRSTAAASGSDAFAAEGGVSSAIATAARGTRRTSADRTEMRTSTRTLTEQGRRYPDAARAAADGRQHGHLVTRAENSGRPERGLVTVHPCPRRREHLRERLAVAFHREGEKLFERCTRVEVELVPAGAGGFPGAGEEQQPDDHVPGLFA